MSSSGYSRSEARPTEFDRNQGVGFEPAETVRDTDTGLVRSGGGGPVPMNDFVDKRAGGGPLDFSPENAMGAGAGTAGATTTVAAGAGPAGIPAGVGAGGDAPPTSRTGIPSTGAAVSSGGVGAANNQL